MESSISRFHGAMSAFLAHIQTSSDALTDSLRRRPIPLDSATASFTQRLNQRVSAAASDLELLEDMAMGTVSVAELVGHMSEVYKLNQNYVDLIQDRLSASGFVPESDLDGFDDDEELNVDPMGRVLQHELEITSSTVGLDEDDLFDVSESLRSVGFSDACLATLAGEEDNSLISQGYLDSRTTDDKALQYSSQESQLMEDAFDSIASIDISRNDYNNLPAYVKSLASWEDLQEAVMKINLGISKLNGSKHRDSFKEADFEELGLGRKGKSYILALIRMNKLALETESGVVSYRIALNGIK
ncbi:uncharacterized protein LOC144706573 isoform X2 [Wolffia australiana]